MLSHSVSTLPLGGQQALWNYLSGIRFAPNFSPQLNAAFWQGCAESCVLIIGWLSSAKFGCSR